MAKKKTPVAVTEPVANPTEKPAKAEKKAKVLPETSVEQSKENKEPKSPTKAEKLKEQEAADALIRWRRLGRR